MKRLTMPRLRKQVWHVLTQELDVINVTEIRGCSAHCLYDERSITVWVDPMWTRLDHAVVHEILHKLLDAHFRQFATYHVYEHWITALEKPFFSGMTNKEHLRWHKTIRRKVVNRRKP